MFYRQREDYIDSFDFFVPPPNVANLATNYQQWQTINKKAEKVQINATVGDISDLKIWRFNWLFFPHIVM